MSRFSLSVSLAAVYLSRHHTLGGMVAMRTADEIQERLQIYTQALYFTHAHREKLSPESLAKHRALEENIGLLQWCLAPPDLSRLTWSGAGRALRFALGLVAAKAISCIGPTPRTADSSDTPK